MSDDKDWGIDPDSSVIVIFGASGDLSKRKLFPSLYTLYSNGGMPDKFAILGASRTPFSDDQFRDRIRSGISDAGLDLSRWPSFSSHMYYQAVQYGNESSYGTLAERIAAIEKGHGTGGGRIFNLALPPTLYALVAKELGKAGLSREGHRDGRWARLVVEKPFGVDLASSIELDRNIDAWFDERQVFRIDHYMAKETVQNLLVFRFANAIFEPLWNRNYIEYVRINASEDLGIGDRAGYYEQAGVILDMFQSHMMQLLALVAAEPPLYFDADRVRDKQAELFRSLRPFPLDSPEDHLVLGQYGKGVVSGKPVPGYLEEEGVDPVSSVPTYGLMKVFIDNWRWQGVPFYLTSGKRLRKKVTRIDIQFRGIPHSMLPDHLGKRVCANRLILGIQPKENIFLSFQAKKPGPRLSPRNVGLQFFYRSGRKEPQLDAYAKALLDTMAGDQTLFWREDCLELSWGFFDPLIKGLERGDCPCVLHPYRAGDFGPQAAIDLLPAGSWPEKPEGQAPVKGEPD